MAFDVPPVPTEPSPQPAASTIADFTGILTTLVLMHDALVELVAAAEALQADNQAIHAKLAELTGKPTPTYSGKFAGLRLLLTPSA